MSFVSDDKTGVEGFFGTLFETVMIFFFFLALKILNVSDLSEIANNCSFGTLKKIWKYIYIFEAN